MIPHAETDLRPDLARDARPEEDRAGMTAKESSSNPPPPGEAASGPTEGARAYRWASHGGAGIGAAALLWPPLLLWLTTLSPIGADGEQALHLGAATALALIAARVLAILFRIPIAPPAPGRHRVLPRRPQVPLLLAAAGTACVLWSLWAAQRGALDWGSLAALPTGLFATLFARRTQADPLWGSWMALEGDALRLSTPHGEGSALPISAIVRLHLRPRDRSFYVESSRPERDVFVPTEAAGARYSVSGAEALFQALSERVPVQETELLLQVADRRASDGRGATP